MANQSYIGVAGTTLYRKATGNGTDADPYVSEFNEPDIGSTTDAAATTDTGTFSLIALFKRSLLYWASLLDEFGTTADAASTTGTFTARMRSLVTAVGTQADASSATGSLMARVRYIAANTPGSATATSSELTTTTTASVGSTLTTVLDVTTASWSYLSVKIKNTGATALSDFQVQGFYSSLAPNDYALLAAASITNSYGSGMAKQSNNALIPVIDSFNLPIMGATSDGQLEIDCSRYQRIRLQAKTASSTTAITIDGILKR